MHPRLIRKAIKEEICTVNRPANLSCVAVIKDSRNAERIRVVCRDKAKLCKVREAVQKTALSNT